MYVCLYVSVCSSRDPLCLSVCLSVSVSLSLSLGGVLRVCSSVWAEERQGRKGRGGGGDGDCGFCVLE